MLWICLKEDVCLYHPDVRWEGEFEWPKTLQGPQLENCWKLLSQKTLTKNGQTVPTSPHVVWEGFKKKSPSSSKNKLQHIQLSDTTGTSNGTGFYGLVNTDIKSTPCVQWNILLIFYVVGLYFCWRSWTSCLDTWHHGFYQIPTDKKSISDWLC